jgi:hypothetical protein
MGPHVAAEGHMAGTHPVSPPHWLGTPPPPQVCGAVQSPHWTMPPQPSEIGPHDIADGHFAGTQVLFPPHWFATPPPPQVSGALQLPHWMTVWPQPSPCGPQPAFSSEQLFGTHWLGSPSVLASNMNVPVEPPEPPGPAAPPIPPIPPLVLPLPLDVKLVALRPRPAVLLHDAATKSETPTDRGKAKNATGHFMVDLREHDARRVRTRDAWHMGGDDTGDDGDSRRASVS